MRLPAMSVCLLARLLKNACMDLHDILRVDRWGHGRTEQLLSAIRIVVQMPEPDCFLRYHNALQRGILSRRENPTGMVGRLSQPLN